MTGQCNWVRLAVRERTLLQKAAHMDGETFEEAGRTIRKSWLFEDAEGLKRLAVRIRGPFEGTLMRREPSSISVGSRTVKRQFRTASSTAVTKVPANRYFHTHFDAH